MRTIPLIKGGEVVVDDDDFEWLQHFQWRRSPWGYAHYAANGKTVYMHRMIMEPCEPFWVDHKNRVKLDNRKSNLRLVLPVENAWNRSRAKLSSQYQGVGFNPRQKTWRSSFGSRTGRKNLGNYKTELEAAVAYDIASKDCWGDIAQLNFPDGLPIVTPRRLPNPSAPRATILSATHEGHPSVTVAVRISADDMDDSKLAGQDVRNALEQAGFICS